ncbi:MAG: MFS transporter [Promethearchaeota archaeon]
MAIEEDFSDWDIASSKKMVSYGFGYVIINYFLYGGFALVFFFYEVEIGLSAMLLMFAYIIFALWNMVNDPLLGFLTEKPFKWTRKYGFRAPWVALTAIPILIFYFFIWVPPAGASDIVIFLWFIVITCLFDTFFSIFNDHVYGGFTNQFPSEYERRRAFAITTLLLGFGVTGLGIVANLMIVPGNQSSYATFAFIVVIIMVVLSFILFLGIKESEQMKEMFIASYEKAEKSSFFSTAKTALKTKNFTVSLAGYTVQITAMTLVAASSLYMYNYVWQLPFTMAVLPAIAGLLAFLGMIPFWSNYTRKHGFKRTYWVCFVLHGLSFIPLFFLSSTTPGLYTLIIIFSIVNSVFYSGEVIMLMPVASDTYDEVSSRIERRVDATLVGIRTFFFRIAFIVVAVVLTLIHISTGFNPVPNAPQTALALLGIRIHAYLIPAIIFIIMGFIFRQYYTLEGAEKEALVRKLKDLGIYR